MKPLILWEHKGLYLGSYTMGTYTPSSVGSKTLLWANPGLDIPNHMAHHL